MEHIQLIDHLLEQQVTVDHHDRKILYELMLNARQPLSSIAKQVKLSEQVVHYRIQNLLKKGVITNFVAIFDISKLQMGVYRVFFRLSKTNEEEEKAILNYFIRNKNVFWLARIGGRWDLLVDIVAIDIRHFSKILQEIVAEFPDNLQNRETVAFIDSHQFQRRYLLDGKKDDRTIVYFGGVPQQKLVDNTDLRILKALSQHAHAPNVELSKQLKLSPITIRQRIKIMEKNGIIQGYSPALHPTLFGCCCFKLLLTVHNIDDAKEKKLITFGKFHPSIIFIEKVVGKWDYEYDVECNNEKDFRKLLREMQDQLSDVIVDYEIVPFYYDYKIDYFPFDASNEDPTTKKKKTI
ncbi:Lrp/AsnC family transcriptional regulator [Candidatus Woesearchaeota archaeon]|nr:Lrp/AsnC family transcriptional regulator [Candidatus Woesearchaeota archaeon]